jgi:NAD(P)-dependent dehydrogenase (short-subunit alcohol dehydrogenase family)
MMAIFITGGSRGIGQATAVLAESQARDHAQP